MTVRVETFAGAPKDWDDFALAQQGGTHFHRYGWLDVIHRVHGHDVLPAPTDQPPSRGAR